jgi:tripartite ATP-independent transporter DctP family solute receptor
MGGYDMRLSLLIATIAVVASTLSTAAQERVIKFGHAASSKHIFQQGMEIFAGKVADKTGGKIKIEVLGDRQLGDDKALLEGLQIGTIEGALVSAPTLPLVVGLASFDALQLPFVSPSYEKVAEVLGSDLGDELLATLDEKSMKGVGFIEAGQRHFLSRSDGVKSVADFAGKKTRIVPIPLHKATWEAVGVNPIGMAYGEVYSALETGTIDAVEINLSSIQSESLYESAKKVTLTGHYFWPGVIIFSGATWGSFDDETKAAISAAGKEATTEAYALAASQEADTVKFLEGKGVEISKLEDIAAMKAKTAPVVETWVAKAPLIAKIKSALQGE